MYSRQGTIRSCFPLPWIHIGGGLVEDEHFVAPENGSGETDELSLADGEVRATLTHDCLEAFSHLVNGDVEVGLKREYFYI